MALNKSSVTDFRMRMLSEDRERYFLENAFHGRVNGEVEGMQKYQKLHQESSRITRLLNFFIRFSEFVIP